MMNLLRNLKNLPPPDFPADARMMFCIGAQKAGTTWLYEYLSRHPQCHFSPKKELHYFNVLAGRADAGLAARVEKLKTLAASVTAETGKGNARALADLAASAEHFKIYTGGGSGRGRHAPYLNFMLKGRRGQPLVCDITPAYSVLSRQHFADMATIGGARFVFIMRDPVRRMWSQIRMAEKVAKTPADRFAEACAGRAWHLLDTNRMPNIERANYKRTITEIEAVVPQDRVFYQFYEDLFTQDAADAVCAFLDLDPRPIDTDSHPNKGISIPIPDDLRQRMRQAFAPQYAFVSDKFGDRMPDAWRDIPG